MPVAWHVIYPVLGGILQYLKSVVLPKLKSRSLVEIPRGLGLEVDGLVASDWVSCGFSLSLVGK